METEHEKDMEKEGVQEAVRGGRIHAWRGCCARTGRQGPCAPGNRCARTVVAERRYIRR